MAPYPHREAHVTTHPERPPPPAKIPRIIPGCSGFSGRKRMTPRKNTLVWRLVVPVAIALLPLSVVAQSGAQIGAQRSPDDILKADSYQTPPKELADAVTAPRYLNIAL